ncbi:ornithine carbamoyltransferase [Neobacillus sp. MM2021_6]|uniref:ornithine carbamoyltransferase n=1 Tax=Bacillaceae TaxID=186817 RepID=UPI00140E3EB5|nr:MULTISPECIES: ornithine carbamoyltransferase [Bacillaceae]MBO0958992.1 ornithine carbamoyltransferase [Neobacillus sp. MM2021_6]NHC17722.1 ornithine carbamoyltransferase [Bacillus sp. MM2020_4]
MLMTAPKFNGKSFLCEKDFSKEEFVYLIDLAMKLKDEKKHGITHRHLEGKNIALLFEKPSTRTRCAFTVACTDLGAHPEYLGKDDIQLGKKESVEDTAKVLGRMFDGIEFRGFEHKKVEMLAEHSGVPVWNGLTDLWHPTQTLADFLTVKENFGRLEGIKFVYVGDGRNNVANSLLVGGALVGMDVRICAPESLFPAPEIVELARELAERSGGRVTVTADVEEGVSGADVIYTDVWVSMGEEAKFAERIALLSPYQVTMDMVKMTGNDNMIFLHCLPAFHDQETRYGKDIFEKHGLAEMEVTDEVFRSEHSKVFDQAENRMHTIKAVMAATLGHLE